MVLDYLIAIYLMWRSLSWGMKRRKCKNLFCSISVGFDWVMKTYRLIKLKRIILWKGLIIKKTRFFFYFKISLEIHKQVSIFIFAALDICFLPIFTSTFAAFYIYIRFYIEAERVQMKKFNNAPRRVESPNQLSPRKANRASHVASQRFWVARAHQRARLTPTPLDNSGIESKITDVTPDYEYWEKGNY